MRGFKKEMPTCMEHRIEHYIGTDVDRPDAALFVLEVFSGLEWIAENERAWALKHYSSVTWAGRPLAYCGMA